jgi:hypothetical protein
MTGLVLLAALSAPPKQCRVVMLGAGVEHPLYGEWIACDAAEASADSVREPGMLVWTEERRRLKGKWTKPGQHTEPELVPKVNDRYMRGTFLNTI